MLPATVAVPFAGSDTNAMLVTAPVIWAERLIEATVLNSTDAVLPTTVGAGGAATVIETVPGADIPPGPVAVTVKLSVPTYPVLGEYVTTLPSTETIVPFAGAAATAMLLTVPDIWGVRSIASGVLNATATATPASVGGGAAATVMLTVATAEVPPGPVAR